MFVNILNTYYTTHFNGNFFLIPVLIQITKLSTRQIFVLTDLIRGTYALRTIIKTIFSFRATKMTTKLVDIGLTKGNKITVLF